MHIKTSVAGHFGELLQGRLGPDGPVALVSLPCPKLTLNAWAFHSPTLSVYSPQRVLPLTTARRFLNRIGAPLIQRFVLQSQMPPGGGAGASTASLVALSRLSGSDLSDIDLAQACLAIEGATDPLMLPRPEQLLWSSRQAEILHHLPALPQFEVLGGFYGQRCRTNPKDQNFADISDLVEEWPVAAKAKNLEAIAKLSTLSAKRNLALRGEPHDPTLQIANDINALGVVVAHTGAARGFVFAPRSVPPKARARLIQAGFSSLVHFKAGGL